MDEAGDGIDFTANPSAMPQAGFSSVSVPEMSVDSVTYREGHFIFERSYPGVPKMGGGLTLSRGVTNRESAFWTWMVLTAVGWSDWSPSGAYPRVNISNEYRIDFSIHHHDRRLLQGTNSSPRTYRVYESYCTRLKPASDLDATSSDVSIQDADIAYEYFEVVPGNPVAVA